MTATLVPARAKWSVAQQRSLQTSSSPSVGKGIVAGLIGGLAGAAAMNLVQVATSAVQRLGGHLPSRKPFWSATSKHQREWDQDARATDVAQEPATVQVAEVISERLFGHELSDREKSIAGPLMHFGYGATMGALYGGAAEVVPQVTAGHGLAYGLATWLWGDLSTLPLLGLTRSHDVPSWRRYVDAGVTHFAYGFALEYTRRRVRRNL